MTVHSPSDLRNAWPELPTVEAWQDTYETLHLWTQIVGKVRMVQSPWSNHSWGSTLYVTTRGLTTSPIPYGARSFAIDFDFISHELRVTTSIGEDVSFDLEPMSVADFYQKVMGTLEDLGIPVEIMDRPVELPDPVLRFSEDTAHESYDADAVERIWGALVQADRVFTRFRARFTGKVSPVHFFWGAFDLAVTRFSGREAPKHPGGAPNCADWVMEDAYSEELSSAGFWPGMGLGEAAFYSYAYPEPDGFRTYQVQPEDAHFSEALGEFVLLYEAVRTAPDPDAALLSFLQSTFDAAAELADWDETSASFTDPRPAPRVRPRGRM
jgi:hypothetical protein